jgi:hypothetical protein
VSDPSSHRLLAGVSLKSHHLHIACPTRLPLDEWIRLLARAEAGITRHSDRTGHVESVATRSIDRTWAGRAFWVPVNTESRDMSGGLTRERVHVSCAVARAV